MHMHYVLINTEEYTAHTSLHTWHTLVTIPAASISITTAKYWQGKQAPSNTHTNTTPLLLLCRTQPYAPTAAGISQIFLSRSLCPTHTPTTAQHYHETPREIQALLRARTPSIAALALSLGGISIAQLAAIQSPHTPPAKAQTLYRKLILLLVTTAHERWLHHLSKKPLPPPHISRPFFPAAPLPTVQTTRPHTRTQPQSNKRTREWLTSQRAFHKRDRMWDRAFRTPIPTQPPPQAPPPQVPLPPPPPSLPFPPPPAPSPPPAEETPPTSR